MDMSPSAAATRSADPSDDPADGPGPAADESGAEPGIYYYGDGMRYMYGLIEAFFSAYAGQLDIASTQAFASDCILAPLGEENDPEALRDFIAGAARAIEAWLEPMGVRTP
jgi:hypothetical protein